MEPPSQGIPSSATIDANARCQSADSFPPYHKTATSIAELLEAPITPMSTVHSPQAMHADEQPQQQRMLTAGDHGMPAQRRQNNAALGQSATGKARVSAEPFLCNGCAKPIFDRYLLQALDKYWHEDCLKCQCCDCRLGEVGSTLYTRGTLILCRRDYLRLFGSSGRCAACHKPIPAFEMVMRARNNVYHLECFACQECNHRFCVGDRFYLCDNKILCEYDYDERLLFARMGNDFSNLAQLKRQFQQSEDFEEAVQMPPLAPR